MVNQKLSEGSSQQSSYSNHVGLILSDTELPFDTSSSCSQLFLITKTITIEICLQLWEEDCVPLKDKTFFTLKRDFAVESTAEDLLAAAVWFAEDKGDDRISSKTTEVVLVYENGVFVTNNTTVADLRTSLIFCVFGCPSYHCCVDNEGT
jgi:hypothetical protein